MAKIVSRDVQLNPRPCTDHAQKTVDCATVNNVRRITSVDVETPGMGNLQYSAGEPYLRILVHTTEVLKTPLQSSMKYIFKYKEYE